MTEVATEPDTEVETTIRKSERTRTLTEKGKELQEDKLKALKRRYKVVYEKWRYEARLSKVILTDTATESELKELLDNVKRTCQNVQSIYDEIRQIEAPDSDMRRKVDACTSLSDFIVKKAERWLEGNTEGDKEAWPDVGSCLESEGSKSKSKSQESSSTVLSHAQSIKRVEAAADAAASQEILAVLEEQEKQASKLQKLEVETKQCELENLMRQQAMDEQRRKIERLEEIKRLNAAKARQQTVE
ncbi:hypothetical protein WMY93_024181 [Mugilogobius chulae]|uniref:Uncharacterized protein n=1 Tax=Mugilogobius chulae TaxID=88201 RepID=A0AAW0NBI2_9GOBI